MPSIVVVSHFRRRRWNLLAEQTGKTVKLGRLNWQADSFHIYGKDIKIAKERLFDRVSDMPFEERAMSFNDVFMRGMYDEAEEQAIAKIKRYDESH